MVGAALYGVSAGLQILQGFYGSMAADAQASQAESRARMLRMETEAEIDRYRIQGTQFKAKQKLAYLKNGVQLSGSPLDVLNDTELTIRENISAMRASGEAQAQDLQGQAASLRLGGRAAFLGGFGGALQAGAQGYGDYSKIGEAGTPRNNTTTTSNYRPLFDMQGGR
jgi:hypothetical protein